MPDRSPAVDALVRQAEEAAAGETDPLAVLVFLMKLVIASDADPYLLTGALIEGIAATVARRIPDEKQGEVAIETVRLLRDRFRICGII